MKIVSPTLNWMAKSLSQYARWKEAVEQMKPKKRNEIIPTIASKCESEWHIFENIFDCFVSWPSILKMNRLIHSGEHSNRLFLMSTNVISIADETSKTPSLSETSFFNSWASTHTRRFSIRTKQYFLFPRARLDDCSSYLGFCMPNGRRWAKNVLNVWIFLLGANTHLCCRTFEKKTLFPKQIKLDKFVEPNFFEPVYDDAGFEKWDSVDELFLNFKSCLSILKWKFVFIFCVCANLETVLTLNWKIKWTRKFVADTIAHSRLIFLLQNINGESCGIFGNTSACLTLSKPNSNQASCFRTEKVSEFFRSTFSF